jgi:hypothetical protein
MAQNKRSHDVEIDIKPDSSTCIHIKTLNPIFMELQSLFSKGFMVEASVDTSIESTELVYGIGVDMTTLQNVLKTLNYLPISQVRSTILPPNSIELRLGNFEFKRYNFSVKTNTSMFLETLQTSFGGLLEDANVSIQPKPNTGIQYGGADETCVRLLALQLKILTGEDVELNKTWSDDDADIWIHVVDPNTKGKPIRAWFPLAIDCDDDLFTNEIIMCLKQAGFEKVRKATEEERQISHPGFFFEPTGFLSDQRGRGKRTRKSKRKRDSSSRSTSNRPPAVVRDVETILSGLLKRESVDATQFPVHIGEEVSNTPAVLHVPISKCKNGGIMPYGGNYPGAFPVTIRTDDLLLAEGLSAQLREKGFMVKTAYVDSHELLKPSLDWGEFANHVMAPDLKNMVTTYLLDKSLPPLLPPVIRHSDSKNINLDLPSAKNFPLTARKYRNIAKAYTVSVNLERSNPHFTIIEQKLQELGVRRVKTRKGRGPGENIIHFGGAPSSLMAEIVQVVKPYMEPDFETAQYWGDEDNDIYIFFPEFKTEPMDTEPRFNIQKWLGSGKLSVSRPFISQKELSWMMGTMSIPSANRFDHPRTPSLNEFTHYCIDSQTAELLERVAEAVVGKECLLLEGSTATSKTSSILYLAALIGQPVMRLNLSGATDVSEFVGRFVPDENREGNGWKWEDGPVIKAMTEGYWLILDELNLAESSILERLNSILERTPSLLLSEYNDRMIGGEEFPIHESFRVFGTQNPEHYAGRNALSPAYRDRFHETHVSNPNLNAVAMQEMLSWLIFGTTPSILVNGLKYDGFGAYESTQIAGVDGIQKFVKSISIFHASLCAACGSEKGGVPKLGADRMGGYSFTRRGLLRLVDFLQRHLTMEMTASEINRVYRLAIVRTYLDRVDEKEHPQVVNLLNAAGIGPETWVL